MIVKILNGKTPSIKATIDYVYDEKKTSKPFDEVLLEYDKFAKNYEDITYEDFCLLCEDNINRAFNYISDENKIGGYISGYLCDPEFAEEQFRH